MKAPIQRLSARAKREISREIRRETVEYVRAYEHDLDIAWLYAAREAFNFGKKRLERLYRAYFKYRAEVQEYFQGEDGDGIRELAMENFLKNCGFDAEKIYDEIGVNRLTVAYIDRGKEEQ